MKKIRIKLVCPVCGNVRKLIPSRATHQSTCSARCGQLLRAMKRKELKKASGETSKAIDTGIKSIYFIDNNKVTTSARTGCTRSFNSRELAEGYMSGLLERSDSDVGEIRVGFIRNINEDGSRIEMCKAVTNVNVKVAIMEPPTE